jgi:hypothetical protein
MLWPQDEVSANTFVYSHHCSTSGLMNISCGGDGPIASKVDAFLKKPWLSLLIQDAR